MGIFNDLKKVLFGAKAVTTSAAEKAANAGMEAGGKLMDTTEQYVDQAKQQATNIGTDFTKTASDTIDKAKDLTEGVGEKVLEHTNDLWSRAKSAAEEVGGQIVEKSQDIVEQAKSTAEGVGSKILQTEETPNASAATPTASPNLADDIIDGAFEADTTTATNTTSDVATDMAEQAQAAVAKGKDAIEGILEKAGKMADKLKEKVGDDEYTEEVKVGYDNVKGSLTDGHDDFFEKAAKFAEGDYHNQGTMDTKLGDVTLKKNPDYSKPEVTGTLKGFEDLDGDGDELIDDAIVLDD